VHRDIKPDNLLLDSHDVLKIVDFGVSEMFTKEDDRLKSSSGSPAFASPELSQGGISNVSGKAADIWAMGVTLYALIYGALPFNDHNVLELYENIRHKEYRPFYTQPNKSVYIPEDEDPNLVDVFHKILDKDPTTRIKMPQLRVASLSSQADFIRSTRGSLQTAKIHSSQPKKTQPRWSLMSPRKTTPMPSKESAASCMWYLPTFYSR